MGKYLLGGAGLLALAIIGNVIFWGLVVWGLATFIMPHFAFWH